MEGLFSQLATEELVSMYVCIIDHLSPEELVSRRARVSHDVHALAAVVRAGLGC